jgi:hypothetical protein
MRAILEVCMGPRRGRKVVLEPGSRLRVGRTERADLVIEADRQMAGAHFEVSWDGAAGTLRALAPSEPTFHNGQPITEGSLRNADWIRAGSSVFGFYVEAHTRPRRDSGAGPTPAREAALSALEALEEPLFAVLDAARDVRIVEVLHESVEEVRSLYEGIKGDALADVAPHLVALPRGSRLLRDLVFEGWGRRWGIYLTSPRPFKEVRTHLRRFLMVEDEESRKRMYFRYYDPASLRVFLPSCSSRQLAELFGPLRAFLAEGPDGEVLRFDAPAEAA